MTDNPEPSGQQNNPPPTPGPPSYAAPQPYPYPYQSVPYPGGYAPPPTQAYPGYAPPPPGPRNGLGIASLVIAIVALLSSFSVAGGIVLGIVAVVLGFAGRGRVKRGEANNGGIALAGIILGFLSIIVGMAFIAIWVLFIKDTGAGDYFDCMNNAGQNRSAQQLCEDQFRQSVENKFSITLTPTP